ARPDGVIISSIFIFCVLTLSAISRFFRATEIRIEEITFVDEASAQLWPLISGKKCHLVPLKPNAATECYTLKKREIEILYKITEPVAFVQVHLLDNRSDFFSPLKIKITRHNSDFIVHVQGAVAVANSLAYLSELLDPISIFLGLTRRNLMLQALKYLLWGEGEVGLVVYAILLRYWKWTPEDDVRPRIFLLSD
ncbi:MAG: hypothetical protein ACD_73C00332G0002, partial [uncultured bacterium]